jgi:hypothetical protein
MDEAGTLDDRTRTNAAGRPLGAISTLVSLFLLLLVFFIVLFSIAQVHRQRIEEVVTSIDRAFGGLPSRLGLLPAAAGADRDTARSFVEDATLLLTGFQAKEINQAAASGGALLLVDLAAGQLFQPDSAELTPAALRLVPPLAVLLQRPRTPPLPIRLTVLGVAPTDPAPSLAVARIARLAAALYEAGCPTDRLAIGFDPVLGDRVRFQFDPVETAGAG